MRSARALLAVIGPHWAITTDPITGRRIEDPADRIRRELSEAFAAGVRVIPVLTDQAGLPRQTDLHGHVVVDRSMSSGTATSHAHDTLLPWRTARAAANRTSSVMWFSVPSSSSSPHRPQFDSVLKYPSTSSCVGIGRPAVIPASTPPVTRFEVPQVGYPRRWIEDCND